MENLLIEAYELAETDWTKLNKKQKKYLDNIFGMVVKACILNEESILILTHELKEIARDIKEDPIFSDYLNQNDVEFSEYVPGNASGQ